MNNEENEIKSKLAIHTETHCRKSDFKPHFQIEIYLSFHPSIQATTFFTLNKVYICVVLNTRFLFSFWIQK